MAEHPDLPFKIVAAAGQRLLRAQQELMDAQINLFVLVRLARLARVSNEDLAAVAQVPVETIHSWLADDRIIPRRLPSS